MIKTTVLLSLSTGLALASGGGNLPLRLTPLPESGSSMVAPALPLGSTSFNAASPQPSSAVSVVGIDDQLLATNGDRQAMLESIDNSLRYLKTPSAARIYSKYPVSGISQNRVQRSLVRFRQLVVRSKSANQLRDAVKQEFDFYQAIGKDNQGSVKFTGYYQPIYQASRVPTAAYKYPLYKKPANFAALTKSRPTRQQLEGVDGLQAANSPLKGSELVYMKDRFEALLVQIEGSAKLVFPDGKTTTVGYAGGTDYPYDSIGKMLAKDQKVSAGQLSSQGIKRFFQDNPQEMNTYIPRYNRFAFMRETFNGKPLGSINVAVTPERSIATDKSLMPPGALALVHTQLPFSSASQQKPQQRLVSRYVLDQDTGSAIKGPGRVDYFMGVGKNAGERAGVTSGNGQLYYLLLKK
jgi:membrane-bound lytic murein transglycosylase A